MTVDWTNWLTKSADQQEATWAAYRRIVRNESDEARYTNYAKMDRAIFGRPVPVRR